MRKLFLLFILSVFSFSLCQAQDSIVFKGGKTVVGKVITVGKQKVTYCIPPDSTPKIVPVWRLKYIKYPGGTKLDFQPEGKKNTEKPSASSWYVSVDGGFTVPSISYRDAIAGTCFGARTNFYFNDHIGISAKVEMDLNGTGLNYISDSYWGGFYVFQEYMAGLSYRTGGKPSYPWVDFVGLVGLCNVSTPNSETGGGDNPLTVKNPGNGNGYGFYFGLDFTNSANHTCSFTFGLGCFGAFFSYPDNSTTTTSYDPYSNTTTSTISKSAMKTSLLLPEMYFAINFRLKKPQR